MGSRGGGRCGVAVAAVSSLAGWAGADRPPRPERPGSGERARSRSRSVSASVQRRRARPSGIRGPSGDRRVATAGELAPGVPITTGQPVPRRQRHEAVRRDRRAASSSTRARLSLRHDQCDRFLRAGHTATASPSRMLLGHRSGMGDFGNDFERAAAGPRARRPRAASSPTPRCSTSCAAVPPVAAPGTTYHYSNANTIVLGAILPATSRTAHWVG